MKKIRLLFTFLCLLPAIFALGQKTLTFRFANPRIIRTSNALANADKFEFDVQVKASADTYFYSGQVILNFNNLTLSTTSANWTYSLGTGFTGFNTYDPPNPKYSTVKTVTGTPAVLNLAITPDANVFPNPPSTSDYTLITTSYQNLLTVRGTISSNSGTADISFVTASMNNQQSEVTAASTTALYTVAYEGSDFMNTYVGRLYSSGKGWSQVGGPTNAVQYIDWATAVNTSVWDGTGSLQTNTLSNALAVRIHNGAILDIPSTGQMTASSLENNTSNGLLIHSDATGTGSLIAGTVSGTGTTNAQRYMTTGAWHLVSSPLTGQTVANFLSTNTNVPTNLGNRGMADYNPPGNIWNPFFTDGLANGSLGSGKGFLLRDVTNGTVTFTGSLQVGTIPAATIEDKWNCVGNPYTSAIGISANGGTGTANFLTENASNLDPAYGIYVWDQPDASNGLTGKYTAISNVPIPFEPAFSAQQGQGFFVKMQVTKSSVNFTPAMQFHNPALALKSTKGAWPCIELDAFVNNQKSSTFIAFNSQMTKGLDPTYDAGLFTGGADLAVYTRLVNDYGIPFAIQALPDNDLNNLIIPVGIESKSGGNVVFSAQSFNLPADCKVIFEDKLNNTFTNLALNDYKTNIENNSNTSNRFFLHTSYLTTGLNNKALNQSNLIVYTIDKNIFISGKVSTQAHFRIYNSLGQKVGEKQAQSEILNVLDGSALRPGVYILNTKDKDRNESVKFVFGN